MFYQLCSVVFGPMALFITVKLKIAIINCHKTLTVWFWAAIKTGVLFLSLFASFHAK